MIIGVLAFQGDVSEHVHACERLGVDVGEVRSVSDLNLCDRLIIPGGESTVISKFLHETGVGSAIVDRYQKKNMPILGTCAGAILLSSDYMNLIDCSVDRNAYGSQVESFEADIDFCHQNVCEQMHVAFIRAPKITRIGDGVEVLASYDGDPVCVRQGNVVAATFHSELFAGESLLHRYFVSM